MERQRRIQKNKKKKLKKRGYKLQTPEVLMISQAETFHQEVDIQTCPKLLKKRRQRTKKKSETRESMNQSEMN
jgi:bifunctional N-acetylglucosamine-1-phosphate-uridyltransferase/glucosamine-1-phosphate-acetyltransferase GlmU-like protein